MMDSSLLLHLPRMRMMSEELCNHKENIFSQTLGDHLTITIIELTNCILLFDSRAI